MRKEGRTSRSRASTQYFCITADQKRRGSTKRGKPSNRSLLGNQKIGSKPPVLLSHGDQVEKESGPRISARSLEKKDGRGTKPENIGV